MADNSWNFAEWETALGLSSDDMEENIRGTDEVKLTSRLNRTEEEIEKYSVDESFNDIEKAEFLLKSGVPAQKVWVASNLIHLIKESMENGKLDQVTNKVLQNLITVLNSRESAPYQAAIGSILADLLERTEPTLPSKIVQGLLPVCVKLMASKNEDIVQSWAQVTLAMIRHLVPEVIENELLPDVLFHTSLSPPPSTVRMFSCKVMGAAAQRLCSNRIESLFLRKALGFCQDTNYEIRKLMCSQLPFIAAAVSQQVVTTTIIDEIMELFEDEEAVVREAMLQSLPAILPFLNDETNVKLIIPQWKKFCEDKSPVVQKAAAQQFGQVLWQLKDLLSVTDHDQIYNYYFKFANHSDANIRAAAVYNIPCVLQISGVEKALSLPLEAVFKKWSGSDSEPAVRSNFGKCIHECARLLGKHASGLLKDPLIRLLSIPNELPPSPTLLIEQTKDPLLTNLPSTLKIMASSSNGKLSNLASVLPVVISKHKDIVSKGYRYWRIDQQIIQSFDCFLQCFPNDEVFEQCVPVLLNVLSQSPVEVIKNDATNVLCTFMRSFRRIEQREFVWRQMYDKLRSKSFQDRLRYLSFCQFVIAKCSRSILKDHFLSNIFDLARDRVPNVRLKVCELLGPIRSHLRAPADANLIQRYNEVVRVLCTLERDQDVVKAATKVNQVNQQAEPPAVKAQLDLQNRQRELEEEATLALERGEEPPSIATLDVPAVTNGNHSKKMLHGNPAPWSGHVPAGIITSSPVTPLLKTVANGSNSNINLQKSAVSSSSSLNSNSSSAFSSGTAPKVKKATSSLTSLSLSASNSSTISAPILKKTAAATAGVSSNSSYVASTSSNSSSISSLKTAPSKSTNVSSAIASKSITSKTTVKK